MDSGSVVAVYRTHTEAEAAVGKLSAASYDIQKVSIIGKDYHSEEKVVGYYTTGDRMKAWGGLGAFWGGIWGLLFGAGFFLVPGLGPVLVGGPFLAALVGAGLATAKSERTRLAGRMTLVVRLTITDAGRRVLVERC